ncbi:arsenite efflux transporter metallochaperone ArsD [Halobiforma nitratireducens]|uniref:Arsenic resistance protein ArsD n=1 Tax=Halobiforma nitratireducens JCM 10879 TaxID=1227454 RepID=M0M779_9EURY|nr:arsenite efflux transporter metallochaperone ArsD [Halobiforma nitratireducens]EMA40235.1 arsenic resistance protein ArsD [Halobiforma nitratireducens JCM 10879]
MIDVTIFEDAMCCSTGVCGPDPDEELVQLTRTVDRLRDEYDDIDITRANLANDVGVFLHNQEIYDAVQEEGPSILPITTVDGEVVEQGEYLQYETLESEIERRLPERA